MSRCLLTTTWAIDAPGADERDPGELDVYGRLEGASDVVLTLDRERVEIPPGSGASPAVASGTFRLRNNASSFEGTIVNKSVAFATNSGSLANAIYLHHGGDFAHLGGATSTLAFRGLQFSERLPESNVSIGNGGLEIASSGSQENAHSVGVVEVDGNLTFNGDLNIDVKSGGADQLWVYGSWDPSQTKLVVRNDGVGQDSRHRIIRCDDLVGEFDETNLPSGYEVSYEVNPSDNKEEVYLTYAPKKIYVDKDATGAEDGLGWDSAFTDLQDALSFAATLEQGGSFTGEIWVAEGVYFPDGETEDRTLSFEMIDGISLFGGFDGTETLLSERDVLEHVTVLSGDIDGDDTNKTPVGITPSSDDIAGGNSYSVVYCGAISGVLDGFTITGGLANGATSEGPGGAYGRGGAIFIRSSVTQTPTISNCRLIGNYAQQGGAAFVRSISSANFISCDFRGNESAGRGGACYYWRSRVITHSCHFSGNLANHQGGAIYDDVLTSGTTEYLNCTLTGNRAVAHGGAIQLSMSTDNLNTPQMLNTIIWNNLSGSPGTSVDSITGWEKFTFAHSNIEHLDLSATGISNFDGTSVLSDPGFKIPVSPGNAPFASGDSSLLPSSAMVDAGGNSLLGSLAFDLEGRTRTLSGTVDLGAYELDQASPVLTLLGDPILYLEVDDAATFNDPGVMAMDDGDGDISAEVGVIGTVDMGVPGIVTLTYLVADAAGNASSLGRQIVLSDTTKPVILAPANVVEVEISGPAGVPKDDVNLGIPVMTDNATADPVASNDAPDFYPLGTTAVTWYATDASLNVSEGAVQYVEVVDTTSPVFSGSGPLADVIVQFSGSVGGETPYTLSDPVVTDPGNVLPAVFSNAPANFPVGRTTVTWTARDSSGNETTVTQDVVVTVGNTGDIIYVDHTVSDGDGLSWVTAFSSLQDALASASPGDEIWVAQGRYFPALAGNRATSFTLLSGVSLYGGFDGNELVREQRDVEANIAILSGDIDRNDVGAGGVNSSWEEIRGGNSGTVVYVPEGTTNARLDGFTITGGSANLSALHEHGGGLLAYKSSLVISQCHFSGNRAEYVDQFDADGGAIFASLCPSLVIDSCQFQGNYAESEGGAIRMQDVPDAHVSDCLFLSNTAKTWGGGVDIFRCSIIFTNCAFRNNEADWFDGGAGYILESTALFENCLFTRNKAGYDGAAMLYDSGSITSVNCTFSDNIGGDDLVISGGGKPTFVNCIVWGGDRFSRGLFGDIPNPTLVNCLVEGDPNGGLDGTDPNNSPLFVDSVNGDYRQLPLSPTVDAGVKMIDGSETDLAGNLRFQGAFPDLGAYEMTSTKLRYLVGVSSSQSDAFDLTTWYPEGSGFALHSNADSSFTTASVDGTSGMVDLNILDPDTEGSGALGFVTSVGGQTLYSRLDISLFGDAYELWIDQFYPDETDPAIVGFGADPTGSGVVNALAFLHGSAPGVSGAAISSDKFLNGEDIEVRFRRSSSLTGYVPVLEYSVDLDTWSPVTGSTGGMTVTTDSGAFGLDSGGNPIDQIRVVVDGQSYPDGCFFRQGISNP